MLPLTQKEIAFAGRSNVGKSSLINALANRKQLARVSKTPGRTQLLNLFELAPGQTIVDLPGYGFAKVNANVRNKWGPMIERYITEREALEMLLVLVDGEIGPTKLDVAMLDWLEDVEIDYQVIATKHDKVKSSQREKRKNELAEKCGLEKADIIWVSASKGVNIDHLRGKILEWLN